MKAKPNDPTKALFELAVMWNCGKGIDEVFEDNAVEISSFSLFIFL